MLFFGFTRYGEKTIALYSASIKHLRNSLLSRNTDGFGWKSIEDRILFHNGKPRKQEILFRRTLVLFISVFTDVIISTENLQDYIISFQSLGYEDAFKMVNKELEFAYDFFYTKKSVSPVLRAYNRWTILLTSVASLIIFYKQSKQEEHIHLIDWILTKVVLFATIAIEMFSYFYKIIQQANIIKEIRSSSISLSKYSLIDGLCVEYQNVSQKKLAKDVHVSHRQISQDMKDLIYSYYLNKSKGIRNGTFKYIRGMNDVIDDFPSIEWTKLLDFHHRILIWHIATARCYYFGDPETGNIRVCETDDIIVCETDDVRLSETDDVRLSETHDVRVYRTESKTLSDYMMYLVAKCQHMLPVGTGFSQVKEKRALN
ncbi:Disease resistance protein [Quillaja saponaria]|uniref:Disease resistance protein n=1 Tax=Quillaja saponaria TaxID=32244 RepID=A0AAD7PNP7_QUISA|nr:Disease resistance protein [Quillaja saponaria]